jgi:protein PhnA
LNKDVKVNGSSVNLKQGTVVKKISLTDIVDEFNGKVDGMSIVLKTAFVKKK